MALAKKKHREKKGAMQGLFFFAAPGKISHQNQTHSLLGEDAMTACLKWPLHKGRGVVAGSTERLLMVHCTANLPLIFFP